MSVMVAVQQCFLVENAEASVHDIADALMEHLVTLSETEGSQVLDSAVDPNTVENTVIIDVTVSADDIGGGVNVATGAMRTAIHATGGNTPQWFTAEEIRMMVDSVGRDLRVGTLEQAASTPA